MDRSEIISRLRDNADALREKGAVSMHLFGSLARGEADGDSDVDLFIDYDPAQRFSLIDLVGIQQFIEERIDAEIDITTRDSLHPALKDEIERSAIRVF